MEDYFWFLAISAIIFISWLANKISNDILKARKNLQHEIALLKQKEHELLQKEVHLNQQQDEFQKILEDTKQEFPYLSEILAEWSFLHDNLVANMLSKKQRPALKAAEQIRQISKEKRLLEKKCNAYRNQLVFYETIFPWLEEFKELPPQEVIQYIAESDEKDEYSYVRNWLSPEEYASLSSDEKWQLALNRYVNRSNKTDWHVGIEYERYIGYVYEAKGYKVHYTGANQGLEDRGRDLIVERENDILVIQCKRWAKRKEIHEKHIMQLFGSVAVLNKESKDKYKGVFITTATLSDTARYFAKLLDIEVVESYNYNKNYPMIKCNISKDGEKIYHLPFDQQYDKVHIDTSKGNVYVSTVAEAEQLGFRHAYKWHGTK
jgi:hypothetical protein